MAEFCRAKSGEDRMKYSPEIIKEICRYIENGNSHKDAAALAGICEDTFYEWRNKSEFAESLKKAELKCKMRNILLIQKAAQDTWTAAAWFLERRYFDEYGRKQKLEHSGEIKNINQEAEALTDDELHRTLQEIRKHINAGTEKKASTEGEHK